MNNDEISKIPSFGAVGGFSAGARSCIGKHLALLNAKIGLIKFMKRYETIVPLQKDVNFHVRLVYSPDPITCKLKKSCLGGMEKEKDRISSL